MTLDANVFIRRLEGFESGRLVWDSHWQELVDYIMPGRAEFTSQKTKGSKRYTDIFDSTAIRANRILAAGMHGQMTSPSMPWFTLGTEDPDLMKIEEVRNWLMQVERVLYAAFNGSNFNSSIHEDYLDLGGFGTSCLYEEEDPQDTVRFFCHPISECYISENSTGKVDTVYRKFVLTARQAKQKWGDKAGEVAAKCMEQNKPDDEISFLHCVYPRDDFDPASPAKGKKRIASVFIELSKKQIVGEEGGYDEMPFFVNRWLKAGGEVYGRSPGMEALPDIKMLNAMAKTILKAAQKMVDPPIIVPSKAYLLPLKTTPNSTIYRVGLNPQDRIEPLVTGGNIPIGLEMKNERRQFIKEAFFVDLFLMLTEKPKMTATEVMERVEEKMVVLGPTIGRAMIEKLDPIIKRTFNICVRQGKIPPKPAALEGIMPEVEYISPLAKAQKLWAVNATQKWMNWMSPLGEAKPDIYDWIKEEGLIGYVAYLLGVPPDVRNSAKEVEAIRKKREEEKENAAMLESLMGMAKAAKDAGVDLSSLIGGAGAEGGIGGLSK